MTEGAAKLREQNDRFRGQLMVPLMFEKNIIPGKAVMTQGIAALGPEAQIIIASMIREFDDFSEDNDPYGEHDFGALEYEGQKIFWKIDYYDSDYQYGSEDPADLSKTCRVLTIMLAEEY